MIQIGQEYRGSPCNGRKVHVDGQPVEDGPLDFAARAAGLFEQAVGEVPEPRA